MNTDSGYFDSVILLFPHVMLGDSQAIVHLRSGLSSVDFGGTVIQRLLSTCGEIGKVAFSQPYSRCATSREIALHLAQNTVFAIPSCGEFELSPGTLGFETRSGRICRMSVSFSPEIKSLGELPSFNDNIRALSEVNFGLDLVAITQAALGIQCGDTQMVLPVVILSTEGEVDAFVSYETYEGDSNPQLFVATHNDRVPQTGTVFQRCVKGLVSIGAFERCFDFADG